MVSTSSNPVDTGRKLNVHKTFRRRLLNVLCTFNLRPVSTGKIVLNKRTLEKQSVFTRRNRKHSKQKICFHWTEKLIPLLGTEKIEEN